MGSYKEGKTHLREDDILLNLPKRELVGRIRLSEIIYKMKVEELWEEKRKVSALEGKIQEQAAASRPGEQKRTLLLNPALEEDLPEEVKQKLDKLAEEELDRIGWRGEG